MLSRIDSPVAAISYALAGLRITLLFRTQRTSLTNPIAALVIGGTHIGVIAGSGVIRRRTAALSGRVTGIIRANVSVVTGVWILGIAATVYDGDTGLS